MSRAVKDGRALMQWHRNPLGLGREGAVDGLLDRLGGGALHPRENTAVLEWRHLVEGMLAGDLQYR